MLLQTAKEMLRTGLVEGTSGNLSARLPDGNVLLTPSSLPYETMTIDDLVVCDPEGNVLEGTRGPTSEKALHCTTLRLHADVGAVIHSHAKFASMFAVVREPIPAVIEEFQVYVGGDVPVAEYKETGSDALADEVAKHVGDRSAVLMANHGLLTVGANPAHAMKIAALVERTAEIVWGARQLGAVHELPADLRSKWTSIYGFLRTNPM
ncbi:MAG: class II aldolase/adducin family protein [Actinobacteria bacterium]|nr:class II aldolase/adducin family protein [Actinomycetota bacterium]